ncbi:hypothetical protein WA577_003954, partial [Blastocystis sp. JDR]
MEAFHHPLTPAKEFLDCLALHFVLSPLRDDPVVCEDRFLQNGLRLSELPREDEGVACEEDRSEDERELSQCRTLLANSTAESQQLYRSLMQATSLPSLKLRSDKAFLKRCYCCFTYCCHHLSLVGLVTEYAQFLPTSALGCPNILKILWRFGVMQLLSQDADLSAVELGVLRVSSLFSFTEANKP